MYYHTDCGHIISEDVNSMMISEVEWRHYTHMYLADCPRCESKYPYLEYLDESIQNESEQELVYKIIELFDYNFYVPHFQKPVQSIRILDTELQNVESVLDDDVIKEMSQRNSDVLIRLH